MKVLIIVQSNCTANYCYKGRLMITNYYQEFYSYSSQTSESNTESTTENSNNAPTIKKKNHPERHKNPKAHAEPASINHLSPF